MTVEVSHSVSHYISVLQVCLVGDSVGAILAYDALCLDSNYFKRASSDGSINEDHFVPNNNSTGGNSHGSTGNVNHDTTGE